jgi:hypothetical protein
VEKKLVLGAALFYAEIGWRVFPVHSINAGICSCSRGEECENPGKHPRTPHGLKDATVDPELIRKWWSMWPDANVAIATGIESGIFVVDVDPKNDGEIGFDLLVGDKEWKQTPLVLTGGGGKHYYFKYPEGEKEIRNRTGLRQGVDIRGEGGYVLAPPSDHIAGASYTWEASSSPRSLAPPIASGWLLKELLSPSAYSGSTNSGRVVPEDVLSGVEEGTRDVTLFRYACSLRDKGMGKTEAIELIKIAASRCDPPYPEEVAVKKVERVWRVYSPSGAKALALEDPEPEIEGTERTLRVEWKDKQVFARARNIKEHSNGDITAFLAVGTYIFGQPKIVHEAKMNFAATRTRKEWANILGERCEGFDWLGILGVLSRIVVSRVQQGEPSVVLDSDDDSIEQIQYAICPMIVRAHPNVIFGERGSGKSYVGVLLSYLIALGKEGGKLGFEIEAPLFRPMVLDWEGDPATVQYRLRCLSKGMELPPVKIGYRRCSRPLIEDADRVKEELIETQTDFVLVDSLGPACGGDLNSPQPAIDFFNALRSLNVSSVIIAHTSKSRTGAKSIFGSVFFENLARSIWEIRSDHEEKSRIALGLIHRKSNFSGLHNPFGLKFIFIDGETIVTRTDVRDLIHAQGALQLTTRILELLRDVGKMKSPDIAKELGEGADKVRATLNHLKRQDRVGKFTKSGQWYIPVSESEGEAPPVRGQLYE